MGCSEYRPASFEPWDQSLPPSPPLCLISLISKVGTVLFYLIGLTELCNTLWALPDTEHSVSVCWGWRWQWCNEGAAVTLIALRPSCCGCTRLKQPGAASASCLEPATPPPCPYGCGTPELGLIPSASVSPNSSHPLHSHLYSPNAGRDEGWRLQSLCLWRHWERDKPAIWKGLDIYLPKGKTGNRMILQGHASA